jgi:rhodanese-related sulfurtransferase
MDPGVVGVIVFLVIAAMVWLRFGPGAGGGADLDAVKQALEQGASVLDVRTPGEFSLGHVRGAVNIPVDELGLRLSELGKPTDQPIVVYCRSGMRSRRATSILRDAGWEVLDMGRLTAFPADMRS